MQARKRIINRLRARKLSNGGGYGCVYKYGNYVPWEELLTDDTYDQKQLCQCRDQKHWRYSCRHDTFYCKHCNVWLRSTCGCSEYCTDRPERPTSNKGVGPDERRDTPKAQFYDFLNLSCKETGIPDVYIRMVTRLRGQTPHVIVFCQADFPAPEGAVEVSISSNPEVQSNSSVSSRLPLNSVFQWIIHNEKMLLSFWNGISIDMSIDELCELTEKRPV